MSATPVTRTAPACPSWCDRTDQHEAERFDASESWFFHDGVILETPGTRVSLSHLQPFDEQLAEVQAVTDICIEDPGKDAYTIDEARCLALSLLSACQMAVQGTSCCPVWCDDHYTDPEVPGHGVHRSRNRLAGEVDFRLSGTADSPNLFASPTGRGMPVLPLSGRQERDLAEMLAPWVIAVLRG